MQFHNIVIVCLAQFYGMPNNLFCLFKPNSIFSSRNNRSVDLLLRCCAKTLQMRIKLLLLFWFDEKRKSKENVEGQMYYEVFALFKESFILSLSTTF